MVSKAGPFSRSAFETLDRDDQNYEYLKFYSTYGQQMTLPSIRLNFNQEKTNEMGIHVFFSMLTILIMISGCATQKYSEAVRIETRPNSMLNILVEMPEIPSNKILVLFPGKNGRANVSNILTRTSSLFVGKGVPVATVDSGFYRQSSLITPEHLSDIRRVVEYLEGRGFQSIYLVGTSNGTITVAYIGSNLIDEKIKGLIMTGTQSYYIDKHIPIGETTYPVLFIHHKYDKCPDNSHDDTLKMSKKYVKSPKVDFITVYGGRNSKRYPCDDMTYHDFWQEETWVVQAITDWVFGKDLPKEID